MIEEEEEGRQQREEGRQQSEGIRTTRTLRMNNDDDAYSMDRRATPYDIVAKSLLCISRLFALWIKKNRPFAFRCVGKVSPSPLSLLPSALKEFLAVLNIRSSAHVAVSHSTA